MRTIRRQIWPIGVMSLALALWLLLAVRPVTAQEDGTRHTVQAGETLRRIAERYGMTVETLAAANRLVNPNLIFAGQVLVIPDGALQEDNDAEADTTGADAESDTAESFMHVVRPGETLTRIAAAYSVTTNGILRLNRLANPNLIFAGQRLRIPGTAAGQIPGTAVNQTAGAIDGQLAESGLAPATKRIVVDKSEQRAYVYENDEL